MTGLVRCLMTLTVVLVAGCAAAPPEPAPEEVPPRLIDVEQVSETPVIPSKDAPAEDPAADADPLADDVEPSSEALLDRTQRTVTNLVVGTAQRVDNLFGSAGVSEEASVTRGRLSVGGQYDQRDGFRSRFRLRARYNLPRLDNRTALILGRGDANDLVDGSGDDNIDTLPNRFNDFEDEDWLLGIGYSRDATLRRGWSFGGGVKLGTPLEPFVRATYRRNKTYGERWLWRLEPRIFLQNQRGAGLSVQNTVDYAASERWLFRSWTIAVVEEEVEGVSWTSKAIAYRNLNRKSAMSYAVYSSGETDFEVPVRDYGVELRYRRQIAREWLFIELLGRLNWPRESLEELRESNVGVGIEFELQFGDWPGRNQNPAPPEEARLRFRASESIPRQVVHNRAGMRGGWRAAGTSL
jgi:hypothetical protein